MSTTIKTTRMRLDFQPSRYDRRISPMSARTLGDFIRGLLKDLARALWPDQPQPVPVPVPVNPARPRARK